MGKTIIITISDKCAMPTIEQRTDRIILHHAMMVNNDMMDRGLSLTSNQKCNNKKLRLYKSILGVLP